MNWLLARLREGSTWRGIVWLLAFAGVSLKPEQAEAIIAAGMALAGLLGVFLQDRQRSPTERTRETDLPAIEFQGRPESTQRREIDTARQSSDSNIDLPVSVDERDLRLRPRPVSSHHRPQNPESVVRDDSGSGYNG